MAKRQYIDRIGWDIKRSRSAPLETDIRYQEALKERLRQQKAQAKKAKAKSGQRSNQKKK